MSNSPTPAPPRPATCFRCGGPLQSEITPDLGYCANPSCPARNYNQTIKVREPSPESNAPPADRRSREDCVCGTQQDDQGPCFDYTPESDAGCVLCSHRWHCHTRWQNRDGSPRESAECLKCGMQPFFDDAGDRVCSKCGTVIVPIYGAASAAPPLGEATGGTCDEGLHLIIGKLYEAGFTDAGEWGAEAFSADECATQIARALADTLEVSASRLSALEAENERLHAEVNSYEEREAACCPEDVGFEEYITVMEGKIDRVTTVEGFYFMRGELETAGRIHEAIAGAALSEARPG